MKKSCKNIYQIARNSSGLTQEIAAELLAVSTRSLSDYESGNTIPHGDIVASMIKIYKTSWLGYEHLRLSSQLGRQVLPVININDLAQSVLSLQKESIDVKKYKPCMIEIASNSKVDDHQKERWQEVTKEIYEMVGAALSVVYSE